MSGICVVSQKKQNVRPNVAPPNLDDVRCAFSLATDQIPMP